jgi:hypothetical protein
MVLLDALLLRISGFDSEVIHRSGDRPIPLPLAEQQFERRRGVGPRCTLW